MIREETRPSRVGPAFVFALDPGETTGYAWMAATRGEVASGVRSCVASTLEAGRMGWGQIPMTDRSVSLALAEARTALEIRRVINRFDDQCQQWGVKSPMIELVIEDFVLRERTQRRDLLSPVRLTSSVVTAVELDPYLDVMLAQFQSAANAKTVIKDERLRRQGLWIKGQQHARDALRHLLLYMRTRSV